MKGVRSLVFVAGLTLVAGSALAQSTERRPISQQTLKPVTVVPSTAKVAPQAAAAINNAPRDRVPLLGPFGPVDARKGKGGGGEAERSAQPPDQSLALPGGPSAATMASASASVTTSFRGINIFEAGVFTPNDAFFSVPPDVNAAASSTRVIHTVNTAVRMFNRQGSVLQTVDLNAFFGTPVPKIFEETLFDPKIIYDPLGPRPRFYIVALNTTAGTSLPKRSTIYLAVSRSANPANLNPANWCKYQFSGRQNAGTQLDSWSDFPSIGASQDAFVISNNQFTFNEFAFTFPFLRVFRKLQLSNNANSCPAPTMFTFRAADQPGDGTKFTVQPVQQVTAAPSFSGTSNPMYLINTFVGQSGVPQKNYRVWRLRNVAGNPTLSQTTVSGNYLYFSPPNVGQNTETGFLTTNDERMEEASGVGNNFWGTHATACGFSSGNVSCVRVIRVHVGQGSGGALQASISQQTTFGSAREFLFNPALAVNKDETVAVPFDFVSPTRTNNNLSSWWAIKNLSENTFTTRRSLTNGTCQQVVERTGDYLGAEVDPVDLRSFWLSGERARPIAEFGPECLWETHIIRVQPAAAATVASGSNP
jgi:hypothetical protein